jgi:Uma2 family endonuclease
MAARTLVSVEEYLRSSYDPDCDFVDGRTEERNVGERDHGRLQARLAAYFFGQEKRWRIQVLTEVRVRVKANRVRIPDVLVMPASAPTEQVIATPPLLCVEILSTEDRMGRVLDRIKDYLEFGVPTVWVVDPQSRRAQIHTRAATVAVEDGILRAGDEIQVPLQELFD